MNFEKDLIHKSESMTRMELRCPHQDGVIYITPAPKSWVCDTDTLISHSLSGFMQELTQFNDPKISNLMQEWGLYYRPLPRVDEDSQSNA